MRTAVLALLLAAALPQEDPLARAKAKVEEARAAQRTGGDFETPGKAAVAIFDEILKADPASVEARAGRGGIKAAVAAWKNPQGEFRSVSNDLEAAIADFDAALKADPARADFYAGRGFARFKFAVSRFFARVHVDELFRTAFEDFTKAIELKPGDASLYVLRGDAHHEKAMYARYRADPHKPPAEAALADFRKAAELGATGLEARIAACGKWADSPAAVEDKGPSIVWSKTWELARREAKLRQVPIFFYVSGGAG
jgi:tetratricopeptide (TPR) repeat protein